MSSPYLKRRPQAIALLLAVTLLASACGSDGTDPDPTPAISVTLSPTSASVQQGGSTTLTATVTGSGGFSGTATITVEGVPAGVTGTVSGAQTTGGTTTATVTIDVAASTAPGTSNITVRGTGSGVSAATATFALTVTAAPAYTLTLSPTALSVDQGASGNTTVNIARTNFTEAVDLSLEGAPAGVTGAFDIDPVTGNVSVLTLNVESGVALGDYTLTVRGTSSLSDRTASVVLTVTAPPAYSLSVTPNPLSVEQGSNGQATVTIARNTYLGTVNLTLSGAPGGVTGTFTPSAVIANTSTLDIAVDDTVTARTFTVTVEGTMAIPGPNGNVTAAALVDQTTPLTVTVTVKPAYALTLSTSDLTVQQGANGTTTVNIARTNFTGAVTLAVNNAPAGVVGTFAPAAPTGNSSTLTLAVDQSVAAQTYALTVNGTSSAGDESVALNLTVTTPPGNFTLSASPAALSITQGGTGSSTININRTGGFAESVSLAVTGQPGGMTVTATPSSTTGNTSSLDISVGAGVTPNTYQLTVTGTAPGVSAQTTVVAVTVTMSGGPGNVTLDFSGCPATERPIWMAAQDGSGPWTQVAGTADVYTFGINSANGGIAIATQGLSTTDLALFHLTQAEFTGGSYQFCDPDVTTKTINGVAAGIGMGESANLSLGGGSVSPGLFANGPFQMINVEDGVHDLVGYKSALGDPATGARMLLRRGLNIPNNGSFASTIDFAAGPDAFDPASGTMTVTGLVGTETLSFFGIYTTPRGFGSCESNILYFGVPGTGVSSFSAFGVPGAQQMAGELNAVTASAFSAAQDATRSITEYFQTMGDRTLALGSDMPVPTLTDLSVGYKRLQAAATVPSEYSSSTGFGYSTSSNGVFIFASSGFLGGTSVTLGVPDFSAVAGWSNTFAPASGASVDWFFNGTGGTGAACTEGARAIVSTRIGTNP